MFRVLLLVLALAGCAPLPPSPADIQAKRFEHEPGKAVIYFARDVQDFSDEVSTVMLDDQMMGSTFAGTYFRWVVEPGRHEIRGYAGDAGAFTLDAAPDRMYFVQQSVRRFFHGFAQSFFRAVPEPYGRALVMRGELAGGR